MDFRSDNVGVVSPKMLEAIASAMWTAPHPMAQTIGRAK